MLVWLGRNSMIVSWWCLIGQDVIPCWLRGGASWSRRNSMTLISGSFVVVPHYII